MTAANSTVRAVDASGESGIVLIKGLFRAYAAEYGPLVALILDVQGFDAEVAGLPGCYAPPSGCLLLAMDGDIAVGCVALRDLSDGNSEMKRLYVTPEHRDRGLGRLLVEEVLRRAARMGYRRMVLDSLPEMEGALALYRRHGFVETAPYRPTLPGLEAVGHGRDRQARHGHLAQRGRRDDPH